MEKIDIAQDTLEILGKVIHAQRESPDITTLSAITIEALCKVSNRATGIFFLFDRKKNTYGQVCSTGQFPLPTDVEICPKDPISIFLQESPRGIIDLNGDHRYGEELPAQIQEQLRIWHADLCCPLFSHGRLFGFAALGTHPHQEGVSDKTLKLLEILCQWTSVAIENKILEGDLDQTQTLVRRTDRLKSLDIIAGGFAHEIRNPLTSIKTFIQLAPERRDDTEFICQFSQVVLEDVNRIERLIQEILDYARYMTPKLADEDLNDVVSSCLYFISVKADSLSISIEKHFGSYLPSASLDRQQIKQVLLNILLNALESMAGTKGSLRVETRKTILPTGETCVQVEVKDTGVGIDPSNLDHIFEPFYSTKHQSGEHAGTGLGLVIAHQIVKEHGGTIQVESDVGKGTTFTITLPVAPIQQTGVTPVPEEHEKTGLTS